MSNDISLNVALDILDAWITDGLKNVRFSGGEPTLHEGLHSLVRHCYQNGVERIAISTNGSMPLTFYEQLVREGVNDFSISLDACSSLLADRMAGGNSQWETIIPNIRELAKMTYVTVSIVLTVENVGHMREIIYFAHDLGVADIRIVTASQYNQVILGLENIEPKILNVHPILKYRVQNFRYGRNVRGIQENDCHKCHLVKDDSVIAGIWQFPCGVYLRERGAPISKVGPEMRQKRMEWFESHNSYSDPICRQNCSDMYIDYNNRCEYFTYFETISPVNPN